MLGSLALVVAGFLFAAPAAQAQTPLDTISNSGVTCKQYSTNYTSYPYTYWDCINTGSNPTTYEKLVGQSARTLPTDMKTVLADVELMIFADNADFASFTGASAPASKYMAWTADSGPGNLSNKRIAAVFENADLYSPSDHMILNRNIQAYYKVHVMQALGRQYDQLTGNPSSVSANPLHYSPIATGYDQFWTDREPTTSVWDAQIESMYPTDTNWTILGHLYGNTYQDIYAFQFSKEFGSSWSHLNSFINSYLHESKGYRNHEVFGNGPARPLSGRWDTVQNQGVFCVEYDTIYDAPADKIYDCLHPYNSAFSGERTAGLGVGDLEQVLKTDLTNSDVELYLLRDVRHFGILFNKVIPDEYKAFAWGLSSNDLRVSAAFWRQFLDINYSDWDTTPSTYYRTTLVHEVGHQLDNIWGDESLQNPSVFKTAYDADLAQIDTQDCTDLFTLAHCNDPTSINQTYSQIFAGFATPDLENCTDILAASVCSTYAGSNSQKFAAIPDVNQQPCNEVFAATVCGQNRKSNSVIFGQKWSTAKKELWAFAFQVTAPQSPPADLEMAMDEFVNLLNYMNTNPDIHANGDPNP